MANPGRGRSDQRICLLISLASTVGLVYGSLVPFDLRAPVTTESRICDPSECRWSRSIAFYSANPWRALHESLVKFLLPIPLGLLLGMTSGFGVHERFAHSPSSAELRSF